MDLSTNTNLAIHAQGRFESRLEWLSSFTDCLYYANRLDHGHYPNRKGVIGYFACYQIMDRYGVQFLMISRHHTAAPMAKSALIEELTWSAAKPHFRAFGSYPSGRGGLGTYATINIHLQEGGKQWYMLSRSAPFAEKNAKWKYRSWRKRTENHRYDFVETLSRVN